MPYVRLWFPVFAFAWACASGCGCGISGAQAQDLTPPPAGSALMVDRLIIKFRTADTDPSRARYLEHLFRDTGVKLTYVRPMGGGVHVFQMQRPLEGAALQAALEQLGKHPDVQYVEPDRPMHHMK